MEFPLAGNRCVVVTYPEGWFVRTDTYGEGERPVASLLSYDPDSVDGSEYFPPGMTRIDIYLDNSPPSASLVENVRILHRDVEAQGGDVIDGDWWELSGGLKAYRAIIYSTFLDGTYSCELLALIEGTRAVLLGMGDLSPFDEVARTLRVVECSHD